jgi:hypothetical protein
MWFEDDEPMVLDDSGGIHRTTCPDVTPNDTSLKPVAETGQSPHDSALEPVTDEILDTTAVWLVPMLLKVGGTREALTAWLKGNYELIVCEVVSLGLSTRQQNHAKVKAFAHRYWRQELKNPGGKTPQHESFDKQKARENAEWTPS